MLGDMFFMACSKLEAMAIYLVKHACGNDILALVIVEFVIPTLEQINKTLLNLFSFTNL